ncbi:protein CpxP [Oxalobacteraceae bacterium GrIS 2.11]
MMNMKKTILLSCAAVGFAAFALLAGAQEHGACKDQANMENCMQAHMEKHMAEREAKLHSALNLTTAQEPAWKALSDSFHQQMAAMEAQHKAMPAKADMDKMSAPDRLANHLTMMQNHITMMQSQLAALKTFYAVLTPEQQTTMNKEMAHFEQRGHHGMHGS